MASTDSENELDNDDKVYAPTSPAEWSHQRLSIHSPRLGYESPTTGNAALRYPAEWHQSPIYALPAELLIHILRSLTDTLDLYNCLFVCSNWCQCAVELLWLKPHLATKESFLSFLSVISPSNSQFPFDSTELVVNGQSLGRQPKESVVEPLFPYARFVRRLNLSVVADEVHDMHFMRLSACIRLERLTLNGCVHLTDSSLAILATMPQIIALDLTGVVDVTDRTLLGVTAASAKIQGINLEGCKKITDEGVLAIAEHCPMLRRIKLCELDNITNTSVSKLAQKCPLLIEIDLTGCINVGDAAVRDIWMHCSHLRELRLGRCINLGDTAFPVPQRLASSNNQPDQSNYRFQNSNSDPARLIMPTLPPLLLQKPLTHLRQLDLMSLRITDDAVAGIVSNAPKLRNLVLAKCTFLTDAAVRSISELGKHLQLLHLGHVESITDASIIHLAQSCVRLRYVDLACCTSLTNASVHALSALPKLRRIGLVKITNLTDDAVDYLTARAFTLERVHLSYCERISVQAIHRLLQSLTKLTHLSLTDVNAFKRKDLRAFCRPAPSNFNETQRAQFCVYSGSGIENLRQYLAKKLSDFTMLPDADDEADSANLEDDDAVQGFSGQGTHPPPQPIEMVNRSAFVDYPDADAGLFAEDAPERQYSGSDEERDTPRPRQRGINAFQLASGLQMMRSPRSLATSRGAPNADVHSQSASYAGSRSLGHAEAVATGSDRASASNNLRLRANAPSLGGNLPNPIVGALMHSRFQRARTRDESTAAESSRSTTSTSTPLQQHSPSPRIIAHPASDEDQVVYVDERKKRTSHLPSPTKLFSMGRSRPNVPVSRRGGATLGAEANNSDPSTSGPGQARGQMASGSSSHSADLPQSIDSVGGVSQFQTRQRSRPADGAWTSDSSREGDVEVEGGQPRGECAADEAAEHSPRSAGQDVSRKSMEDSRSSTPNGSARSKRGIKGTLNAAERYTVSLFRSKGKGREDLSHGQSSNSSPAAHDDKDR